MTILGANKKKRCCIYFCEFCDRKWFYEFPPDGMVHMVEMEGKVGQRFGSNMCGKHDTRLIYSEIDRAYVCPYCSIQD